MPDKTRSTNISAGFLVSYNVLINRNKSFGEKPNNAPIPDIDKLISGHRILPNTPVNSSTIRIIKP